MPQPQLRDDDLDRIRDLETTTRDLCATVAAQTVQIESLARRMEDGFRDLGAKLDAGGEKVAAASGAAGALDKRLTNLEGEAKRARGWIKVLGGAAVAALAWAAKAVVGWLAG